MQLGATPPATLTLLNASVTLNNQTYSGALTATLGVSSGAAITGMGSTAAPNFAPAWRAQAGPNAALSIAAPASGAFTSSATLVAIPNGVAVGAFSGAVTVTQISTATDRVEARGSGSFFTLNLAPSSSANNPVTQVAFQASIAANFNGSYTLTADAPAGWNTVVGTNGLITLTPPPGAAAGDYRVLVVAQSQAYPALGVSAFFTDTIVPYEGMQLAVPSDPYITVPWGAAGSSQAGGDANNGQMQLPGAAYTIDITNTSNISHMFLITITGIPTGWSVLSTAAGQVTGLLTLPAGAFGQLGLYISPTLAQLPPSGSYPFNVTAQAVEDAALSQSAGNSFTVPALAYAQLTGNPNLAYSAPGLSTTVNLVLRNVGNTTGTFVITATEPIATWTATFTPMVTASAGQAVTRVVTLQTPTGAPGTDQSVSFNTASGGYTQTANIIVRLTGPNAACMSSAADAVAALVDGARIKATLASAASAVASAVALWELDPANTAKQQQASTALNVWLVELADFQTLPAAALLHSVSSALSSDSAAGSVSADLARLCSAATQLPAQLSLARDFAFSARFNPDVALTLPGAPFTGTFTLVNQGAITATYAITLQSPIVAFTSPASVTLAPGKGYTQTFTAVTATLGFSHHFADISLATGNATLPFLTNRATGGLNVVSALLAISSVTANPAFVESGGSATALSTQLVNVANWWLQGNATLRILAPDGNSIVTRTQAMAMTIGNTSSTLDFGALNTSGYPTGVYTLAVTVAVTDPVALAVVTPTTGYGLFSVGQGIKGTASVYPAVVAPGDQVVTESISTERTNFVGSNVDPTPIATNTLAACRREGIISPNLQHNSSFLVPTHR